MAVLREAGCVVLDDSAETAAGRTARGRRAARASAAVFAGKLASEFGEPETKAFVRHTWRSPTGGGPR